MKKIIFLSVLLITVLGFSQTVLEDFDGTAPSFTTNNGLGSASIVADPLNGSNMVGEVISAAAGDPWQQADLIMQNNLMDLTSDTTVDVDVYSTTAINILSRIEDNILNTSGFATADAQHTGTGWETLTFDFTQLPDGGTAANGEFSQISFFPSWVGGGAGNNGTNNNWNDPVDGITFLVDNITAVAGTSLPIPTCSDGIMNQDETGIDCGGVCAPCDVPPVNAAPTPPSRAAADVKSIFSDAYTDIGVDTYDTTWCPGTTSDVMIDGNATKKVIGLGCEGVEFLTGRFDATTFTHFHIDFFTNTPTMDKSFNLKLSNWNGGGGEFNAIEFSTTNASSPPLPNPNPGTWISLDIPLTSWTPGLRNDLVQFIITSDLGTVYYDNLYLHKDTVLSTDDFASVDFNVYPNPTTDKWNIKTNGQDITSVRVFDMLGKNVMSVTPNSNSVTLDADALPSGLYFARLTSESGTKTVKLVKQ